ncbi:thioredoxin-like protein 4A isoform X1 [Saccopteryx leptura]|uniref:thioredoxin-like protein 4A isoform X1 n=2 Tax=Saccopteryx leptura TaxID=249018 RepID=UPI00339C880C
MIWTPVVHRVRLPQRPGSRQHVVHASALTQRLAGGPGHPLGRRPRGRHPVRARLGPDVHEDGRGPVQHRGEEMADNGGSSSPCYELCWISQLFKVKNFAVIYLVDITEVPDFNKMYELYDPCTVMFFFRNKHIMIDLGTGNNNKINWAMEDKQEMIDIIETVYRGARKGRGLVVSPKDYSTKYRY